MAATCHRCGSKALRRHCESGRCAWVVCADGECGATSDAMSKDAYFERKPRQAHKPG